jgi:hypothetical protein
MPPDRPAIDRLQAPVSIPARIMIEVFGVASIMRSPSLHLLFPDLPGGGYDYQLEVIGRSIDDFSAFVRDRVRRLPGVRKISTSFSLREVKGERRVPLQGAGRGPTAERQLRPDRLLPREQAVKAIAPPPRSSKYCPRPRDGLKRSPTQLLPPRQAPWPQPVFACVP